MRSLCGAKAADVDEVMRRKVIPLLAEYFFDDWNKLAIVLGDADEGEGDREGGFLDRRQLKVPRGLSGDGEAPPRNRWKVRDTFDYANLSDPQNDPRVGEHRLRHERRHNSAGRGRSHRRRRDGVAASRAKVGAECWNMAAKHFVRAVSLV